MKKFIGLILWAILIILILAVLAGLTFWVVWIKHWPWWFAAALIAGILGLWIGRVGQTASKLQFTQKRQSSLRTSLVPHYGRDQGRKNVGHKKRPGKLTHDRGEPICRSLQHTEL